MEVRKRLCPLASEVTSSHLSHQAQLEIPPYFRQKWINGMSLSPQPRGPDHGSWAGGRGDDQGWGCTRFP